MPLTAVPNFKSLFIFASLLLFTACRNKRDDIPFPADEPEFAQPVRKPFHFGEARSIKWINSTSVNFKNLPVKKFNFNKLPSKPFNINNPVPLSKPPLETKLNWDSLPDTVFNLTNLPSQPLQFKTIPLNRPAIIRAGRPSPKNLGTRGLMELITDPTRPHSFPWIFLRDNKGALWFTALSGVYRFDGEQYEMYDNPELIEDGVFFISEDKEKRLWVGNGKGKVFVLDREAGLLHQLINPLCTNSVFQITEDSEGKIWISTRNDGIFIADFQKALLRKFGKHEGALSETGFVIFEDKDGLIWASQKDQGVLAIDQKKNQVKYFKNGISWAIIQDDNENILFAKNGLNIYNRKTGTLKTLGVDQGITDRITCLYQDKHGKIWIGSDQGTVYCYDEKNKTLEKFQIVPRPDDIVSFFEDESGRIWVGTDNSGCYVLNKKDGMTGNFNKAQGLADNNIWGLLQDINKRIWIGTFNGIDIFEPATEKLKHLGTQEGLSYPWSYKFFEDKRGLIWAGGARDGNNGVDLIDLDHGTIKHIGKKQGLLNRNVASLFKDSTDDLWLSTFNGDIYTINESKQLIQKMEPQPEMAGNGIFVLNKDRNNRLWIGIHPNVDVHNNSGGIELVDRKRKTIKRLDTLGGLPNNRITAVLEDPSGRIWVGTENGLVFLDMDKGLLTSFTTREGLATNSIYSLTEKNGRIYVGTGFGLTIITPPSNEDSLWKLKSYGKPDGLFFLDFNANSNLLTKEGQFWWGIESQTLTIMDEPQQDSFASAVQITGIDVMSKPIYFRNHFNEDKKNLLLGTYRDSLFANEESVASFDSLLDRRIHWDSVSGPMNMPVNLDLDYNQNYLRFHFAKSGWDNIGSKEYRYMLEGVDQSWSAVTFNPQSENYHDLDPGDYTFIVISKEPGGKWTGPAKFSFTVSPPWWQTVWAWALYMLILAAGIWKFIQWRSRKLKAENILLEQKVQQRTAELRQSLENLKQTQNQLIQSEKMASLGELTAGIAHEIQNPLNFVNNFSEVNTELAQELKDELSRINITANEKAILENISDNIMENQQKINYHGKRADAIVKGMLQHSRSNTGQKESADINLLADEYLRLSYHGLRAKDKSFNATMQTHFDEKIGNIEIVPQGIGRVLLNLFNNAFYSVTEKKKVSGESYEPVVSVSTKPVILSPEGTRGVEIRIRDNGNGISQKVMDKIFQPFFTTKPPGQGTGLGLSLSYDIVTKEHGGQLKVNTKQGEYAEFIILLPAL